MVEMKVLLLKGREEGTGVGAIEQELGRLLRDQLPSRYDVHISCTPVSTVRYDDSAAADAVSSALDCLQQAGDGQQALVFSSHRAVTAMHRFRPLLSACHRDAIDALKAFAVGKRTADTAASSLGLHPEPLGGAANAAALCITLSAAMSTSCKPLHVLRLCGKAGPGDAKAGGDTLCNRLFEAGVSSVVPAEVYEMVPVPIAVHKAQLLQLGTIEEGDRPQPCTEERSTGTTTQYVVWLSPARAVELSKLWSRMRPRRGYTICHVAFGTRTAQALYSAGIGVNTVSSCASAAGLADAISADLLCPAT